MYESFICLVIIIGFCYSQQKNLKKILLAISATLLFSLNTNILKNKVDPLTINTNHGYQTVLTVRGGFQKIKNFDPILHHKLEQHFPDWSERMDYQKKQEEFYKSAVRKREEIKKVRLLDNIHYYTKKELDAINYFQGKNFYERYQNINIAPNIYDTRQSFLLKMHNPSSREKFLKSFNRINN